MGWLWFVGTLVPVIGLVQVGFQAMADRYTYIPSIGVFILVIWGANELTRAHERSTGDNSGDRCDGNRPLHRFDLSTAGVLEGR